jgi:hypothetical protein
MASLHAPLQSATFWRLNDHRSHLRPDLRFSWYWHCLGYEGAEMSDLVKRLRSDSAFDRLNGARSESGLSGKAADRIEHLERVLKNAKDDADFLVHCSDSAMMDGDTARDMCRKLVAAIDEALK